jgi:hypothetical protein
LLPALSSPWGQGTFGNPMTPLQVAFIVGIVLSSIDRPFFGAAVTR